MASISAIRGDITARPVDAIVNAANEQLRPGSGVCGAIFAAAGPESLARECAAIGYCATGEVAVTAGFDLPARWVIHTVGPVWQGGANDEDRLLASCYQRVLEEADGIGASSVAIPAISTGVYGFPAERAATIAVETVTETETTVDTIELVAFDRATYDLYERLLSSVDDRPFAGLARRARSGGTGDGSGSAHRRIFNR